MIVDANDLDVEILGKNKELSYDDKFLSELIRDNPSGQGSEGTPFVIIRKE